MWENSEIHKKNKHGGIPIFNNGKELIIDKLVKVFNQCFAVDISNSSNIDSDFIVNSISRCPNSIFQFNYGIKKKC